MNTLKLTTAFLLMFFCSGIAAQQSTNPTVGQLKKDLIGRRISDMPNGYHFQGWYWLVESMDELAEVKVTKATRSGKDLLYDVHLILQGENNRHEANVQVTYALDSKKTWRIATIITQTMKIVRTGRYDKCITARIKGWSGEYELEIINRCDVSIVVGGVVLPEFGGDWRKFSTVVKANETASVGGLFSGSVKDYKIHFIERP
jgi:hypothetical protein